MSHDLKTNSSLNTQKISLHKSLEELFLVQIYY